MQNNAYTYLVVTYNSNFGEERSVQEAWRYPKKTEFPGRKKCHVPNKMILLKKMNSKLALVNLSGDHCNSNSLVMLTKIVIQLSVLLSSSAKSERVRVRRILLLKQADQGERKG